VLASQILSTLNQPWTKYENHWVPLSIVTHLVKQHPEKPPCVIVRSGWMMY
jgi:hypothetical protein